MKKIKTEDGYTMSIMDTQKRKELTDELFAPVSINSSETFTLRDKSKTYNIIEDVEIEDDKYRITIKANGQTKTFITDICKKQSVITKHVERLWAA